MPVDPQGFTHDLPDKAAIGDTSRIDFFTGSVPTGHGKCPSNAHVMHQKTETVCPCDDLLRCRIVQRRKVFNDPAVPQPSSPVNPLKIEYAPLPLPILCSSYKDMTAIEIPVIEACMMHSFCNLSKFLY